MLGGSFWIALLRNGMGGAMMMAVFLMLDRPRISMKKAIISYFVFWLAAILGFSIWYHFSRDVYIRFAGLLSLPVIGVFCCIMSGDSLYLSLYKISLSFYLLSLCVFLGIDISRWWFGESMWVDILIRVVLIVAILFFLQRRFRKCFFENLEFLRAEMDLFSIITLVVCFIIAAFIAYWPADRAFSVLNVIRIFVIMFMAGVIQYLIFHLYIHLGREHCYEAEKQLLEMNEQLLRRQLELGKQAEEEAARIRHDVRHHCLLIREYVKAKDEAGLLEYLKQYGEDVESNRPEAVCSNKAVNGILSVYGGYARNRGIRVEMKVEAQQNLPIRDIDLVAILANIFENAIHGCMDSREGDLYIHLSVVYKGHKLVIQCQNTCAEDACLYKGLPKGKKKDSLGVNSIVKTAERYKGETDFSIKNKSFYIRVLLNIPKDIKEKAQTLFML
jgi:hypothetical protein